MPMSSVYPWYFSIIGQVRTHAIFGVTLFRLNVYSATDMLLTHFFLPVRSSKTIINGLSRLKLRKRSRLKQKRVRLRKPIIWSKVVGQKNLRKH